ncbi:MAG TPA: sialidase family protein [Armatimonadota bacterium]|nr:sialidase family protein [Armatimonadota bacterium]
MAISILSSGSATPVEVSPGTWKVPIPVTAAAGQSMVVIAVGVSLFNLIGGTFTDDAGNSYSNFQGAVDVGGFSWGEGMAGTHVLLTHAIPSGAQMTWTSGMKLAVVHFYVLSGADTSITGLFNPQGAAGLDQTGSFPRNALSGTFTVGPKGGNAFPAGTLAFGGAMSLTEGNPTAPGVSAPSPSSLSTDFSPSGATGNPSPNNNAAFAGVVGHIDPATKDTTMAWTVSGVHSTRGFFGFVQPAPVNWISGPIVLNPTGAPVGVKQAGVGTSEGSKLEALRYNADPIGTGFLGGTLTVQERVQIEADSVLSADLARDRAHRLVVAYVQKSGATRDLKLRVSKDNGKSWGTATTVTSGTGLLMPNLARDPAGRLWLTWFDGANWVISEGTQAGDGSYTFGAAATLFAGVNEKAGLLFRHPKEGYWLFVYGESKKTRVRVNRKEAPNVAADWGAAVDLLSLPTTPQPNDSIDPCAVGWDPARGWLMLSFHAISTLYYPSNSGGIAAFRTTDQGASFTKVFEVGALPLLAGRHGLVRLPSGIWLQSGGPGNAGTQDLSFYAVRRLRTTGIT